MKILVCASVAVLALAATPALAQQSGNYVQGNLGLGFSGKSDFKMIIGGDDSLEDDLSADTGFFASAAFGHKYSSKWAVEAEAIYLDNDVDMGPIEDGLAELLEERVNIDMGAKTYGLMLNANYEFVRSNKTAVYAGAGVGYGKIEYSLDIPSEDLSGKADDAGVMWQLKAGVTYDVSPSTTLDFGYRYLVSPKGKDSDEDLAISVKTDAHVLTAGVRFNF